MKKTTNQSLYSQHSESNTGNHSKEGGCLFFVKNFRGKEVINTWQ